MKYRDTEIVSVIRSSIRDEVGADRFELWFSSTVIRMADETVTICVDNQFTLERLRKSFGSSIKRAVVKSLGSDREIGYVVDDISSDRQTDQENATVTVQQPAEEKPKLTVFGKEQPKKTGRRFSTLESFAVGECNRLANCGVDLVLQQLGKISPLFVHGPTGSGKTHLLEGIWSTVRKSSSRRSRIVYLSAEQFTTYFLQALKCGGLPGFRQKYRAVDLLIIDDVQFFAGKQATIVELLHTIDANLREGGQLVLAADRPPAELSQLGSELTARLSSGLVCEIKPLSKEVRQGILSNLAAERDLLLSPEMIEELAIQAPGDGRQLSGVINRLWVQSRGANSPVTMQMVHEVTSELFSHAASMIRLMDIERAICGEFGIDAGQLKSSNRTRNISHPRMLAMWLARKHTRAALTEIGEYFGRRSHSTVVSAQNKVEKWVSEGSKVQCSLKSCDVRDVVRRIEENLAVG